MLIIMMQKVNTLLNVEHDLKLCTHIPKKKPQKNVNLGWHMDRKEKPISASSIHVGALMNASSL
jgi:hypothetical protein